MRLVIQRCKSASVTVDGEVTGSIERGLVVLCGIHEDDDDDAADWAARKMTNIRLWEDADGAKPWARSALQNGYGILLVSQFTLFASLKGNKPEYVEPSLDPCREIIVGFASNPSALCTSNHAFLQLPSGHGTTGGATVLGAFCAKGDVSA